jgi:uncharacterized protein (DUF2267 family)
MSDEQERFLAAVQQMIHGTRRHADRATRAVLETLAERIDREEARQLATQLPPELAPWVFTDGPAEGFDVDEFVRRVAEREGVGTGEAQAHARAVLATLRRHVSPKEVADVAAELPRDFGPLLDELEGRFARALPYEEFVSRVADRERTDPDAARRTTEAVLETLAERIAGGEVDDLVARLPVELHPPLRRGREHSGGTAQKMPLDVFLRRVAEREGPGVTPAEAREHTRAVFDTLREAIATEDLLDITVQLPAEYAAVGARP